MLDILYAGFVILPDDEEHCGTARTETMQIGQVDWYTSGFE